MSTNYPDSYLPWLLGHDYNFAPFDSLKSEVTTLDDDEAMVLLATKQDDTNLLFIFDQTEA